MNPYKSPQSSLEPESEAQLRLAGASQEYDPIEHFKIIGVISLVFVEVTLGVLLLECLAFATGIEPWQENQIFAQLFPYVAGGFCGVGWILWRIKKASDRKNS
jgi:hypothetical protein